MDLEEHRTQLRVLVLLPESILTGTKNKWLAWLLMLLVGLLVEKKKLRNGEAKKWSL